MKCILLCGCFVLNRGLTLFVSSAHYLDFQEKRTDNVKAFFDELVNWSFAEVSLAKAMEAGGDEW